MLYQFRSQLRASLGSSDGWLLGRKNETVILSLSITRGCWSRPDPLRASARAFPEEKETVKRHITPRVFSRWSACNR